QGVALALELQLGRVAALEAADEVAALVEHDLAGAAQRLARLAVAPGRAQLDAGGEAEVARLALDRPLVAAPGGADRLAGLGDREHADLARGVRLVDPGARPDDLLDLAFGACLGGLEVVGGDLEAAAGERQGEDGEGVRAHRPRDSPRRGRAPGGGRRGAR